MDNKKLTDKQIATSVDQMAKLAKDGGELVLSAYDDGENVNVHFSVAEGSVDDPKLILGFLAIILHDVLTEAGQRPELLDIRLRGLLQMVAIVAQNRPVGEPEA